MSTKNNQAESITKTIASAINCGYVLSGQETDPALELAAIQNWLREEKFILIHIEPGNSWGQWIPTIYVPEPGNPFKAEYLHKPELAFRKHAQALIAGIDVALIHILPNRKK